MCLGSSACLTTEEFKKSSIGCPEYLSSMAEAEVAKYELQAHVFSLWDSVLGHWSLSTPPNKDHFWGKFGTDLEV